ncbi:hypothetical protein DT065_11330 [Salicibibacter kimchii]|uniref:GNAT family N-acetyltransferase n=1 Tax=Salicibibacter kimchii TaxID=2099786 RepID=A0A345C024_9BACI|nr:hypothetical protein DT065_11330 [Salicibibacter kimchii]
MVNADPSEIEIIPLSRELEGEIKGFVCSDNSKVDHFLKEEALVLQESGSCRTHLLYYDGRLVGTNCLGTAYDMLIEGRCTAYIYLRKALGASLGFFFISQKR